MVQLIMRWTLYCDPCDDDIPNIIQYLYDTDKPFFPTVTVKRAHPRGMILPAIYDHRTNLLYESLDECVGFLETMTGRQHLINAIHYTKHNENQGGQEHKLLTDGHFMN